MRVFIFGGTTEGRLLAESHKKSGDAVMVSVASDMGAVELFGICQKASDFGCLPGAGEAFVHVGRLSEDQMCKAIASYDLVLDATHPYALIASKNISAACAAEGVLYQRIERDISFTGDWPDEVYSFFSHTEAAEFLAGTSGNVLLTTGSKNLTDYTAFISVERLYARVLPTTEALTACEVAGIIPSRIIAMHGPFLSELNAAMIRQFDIRYLVTKESGKVGGFDEKVKSCIDTGAALVVIGRSV